MQNLVRAGRSPARVAARARILLKPARAALPRWPRLWTWPSPAYTASSAFRRGRARRAPGGPKYRKQGPGPISSPWPAPRVPRGMTTGRCGPLRASWDWWSRCPTRVRRHLKKTPSPWQRKQWCPEVSASWPTEDVLDLYAEPSARPVVRRDLQRVAGRCNRPPIPARAGASEAGGLRVRKGRHSQPVPDLRAAGASGGVMWR